MKRARLIKVGCLFLLFIGFAAWTMDASGQDVMPLANGTHWQRASSDAKVAFIWGAANVVLVENMLMAEIPDLKRENFSAKVAESRRARVMAGTALTINDIVKVIDQFYKDHPDQLQTPIMRVIWDTMKPNLKTGIAGRPLK